MLLQSTYLWPTGNTCSKIDQPMIWNKPTNAQLEKYSSREFNGRILADESIMIKVVKGQIKCFQQKSDTSIDCLRREKK